MTRRSGDHVDQLISASLTGELTEEERGELNEHLATCASCRDTLAAFSEERRLVSGLRQVSPPHELHARVHAGIEAAGPLARPWWRRSGSVVVLGVSLATVATAALSVVVFLANLPGPVGPSSSPSSSASAAPSASLGETSAPTTSPPPVGFLGSGELGYLSLTGAPFEPLSLSFVNAATGTSVAAGTVGGAPIAAALSPDGAWLAYITVKGETGATETWALHLTDGAVTHLGCSQQVPFADRLAWSPDSRYLAYTLVSVDLGGSAGCEAPTGGTDVWLFETATQTRTRLTSAGNAYAADFSPDGTTPGHPIYVSYAGSEVHSEILAADRSFTFDAIQSNVFMPLFSPDGNRALFWTGTMAESGGTWQFSRDGMPQLSGDFRSTGPASPWLGTPLFSDLTPVGGEAFASGKFAWGADSDLVAFWGGEWTGAPQSADGTYPSNGAYVGRLSTGLLSAASNVAPWLAADGWVVDIALVPDGHAAILTIGAPSAGIGDPPSSWWLPIILPYDGSGIGVEGPIDPTWNGFGFFGP